MCGGTRSEGRSVKCLALAASLAVALMAIPRVGRTAEPAKAPPTQVAALNRPASGDAVPTASNSDSSAAIEKAAAYIQQLGDDRFEVREEASRHLSQMGIEIQPALDAARHDPDSEVRVRVRRILATILKADLERRLNAFAEDVNDTKHFDLPGWSRYRQVVGADRTARQLFVEMQRAEPNLFQAVQDGPAAASSALESAIAHSVMRMQDATAAFKTDTCSPWARSAAMLFVGSDKHVAKIADEPRHNSPTSPINPQSSKRPMSGNQVTVTKKILGAWILRDASTNVLAQNLSIAMRLDLKEGVEAGRQLAASRKSTGNIKQMALTLIGKLGDKSNLPVVESCLKDTEVCGQMHDEQPTVSNPGARRGAGRGDPSSGTRPEAIRLRSPRYVERPALLQPWNDRLPQPVRSRCGREKMGGLDREASANHRC